ncbi:WecB/TagA/CpsF family glycosyltransferase [Sphaerisporangium corydalis]|uniref:WecB/TagA/CpsF family glycosyltransferase n=1 Tax=Sphaerisporangium corydalis TaxID=1441875 RepID=A0ABV9EFE4_9ACTN|nr:WecB/TagA/CpsF family glycosyltransferase [Sphaerisporangium corydalis]
MSSRTLLGASGPTPGGRSPTPEEPSRSPGRGSPASRVAVAGVVVDALTEAEVVRHILSALERGEGGHVVTPNVDICRACSRDPEVRAIVEGADLAVPDGMPLVWASRLLGTPVPERITGADLIWSLSEAAAATTAPLPAAPNPTPPIPPPPLSRPAPRSLPTASPPPPGAGTVVREGVSVYLLGGPPGVAVRAAEVLSDRYPGLRVAGVLSPPYGFEATAQGLAAVREALLAARPRLVFVGLGFPKQDRLIATLRADLPGTWFVGCGSAIAFTAGSVLRAPEWMRRSGLEWLFRLAAEPGRLARRYLVDDLPFALRLLSVCLLKRVIKTKGR